MGLIPIGLTAMREARDQTIEAQIVRQVIGTAALTPFSQLDAYADASPYYFTGDAVAQVAQDDDTRFEVYVSIAPATTFPGSMRATNLSDSVRTLVVETVRLAGGTTIDSTKDVVSLPNTGL